MKGSEKRKDRRDIELLSRNYREFKKLLEEAEEHNYPIDRRKVETGKKIVSHIEHVVDCLEEDDRFIIQKEVVEGMRGNWYLGYFSSSSYYRHRIRAYANFLRCL